MSKSEQIVPQHVGFILDGNRRWAKKRLLSAAAGHIAGYKALGKVLEGCFESGIKYVSLYVFSTENWKRSEGEVSALMGIAMKAVTKDIERLKERNVRFRFLGRREQIGAKLLAAIDKAEQDTRHNTAATLAICFNYGGQAEIVDAARQCIRDGLSPEAIDEQAISDRLYAPDIPPVDLVVRTSGEQRISGFMLWRVSYSEFLFLEKYWPEMTKQDVTGIIDTYNRRERRFGG